MCKITGEYYFGSSFNAKRDSYWGSGRKIKERVAQYGKENFIKEILGEFDDRTIAHQVENQYIEKFRNDKKCLNERIEYHFGSFSEETCAKRSAALRGEKNHNFGKHFSEEHKAKLGAAHRGKHLSDDTRTKISDFHRGKKSPFYGKHHTEEVKAKIGASQRGKHLSDDTRAKIGAALRGKPQQHRGKHWRKNPITGKREYYD